MIDPMLRYTCDKGGICIITQKFLFSHLLQNGCDEWVNNILILCMLLNGDSSLPLRHIYTDKPSQFLVIFTRSSREMLTASLES